MNELIQRLRLSHAEIAERSGLSRAMVKQLGAGNKTAGPEVGAKLASLFRARAEELRELAPVLAAEIRVDADELAAAADRLDPGAPSDG